MKALQMIPVLVLAGAFLVAGNVVGEEKAEESAWLADIEEGVAKAKEEGKAVLVQFTGSDWCPPCMMMHKNVFSKEEFLEKAVEQYVLVMIDIPNADPELRAKNEPVLEEWSVRGVPTIVLLDAEGEEFERFTASQYNTVESFLEHISEAHEKKDQI